MSCGRCYETAEPALSPYGTLRVERTVGANGSIVEVLHMNKPSKRLIGAACVLGLSVASALNAQNPGKTWMQYARPEEAGFSSDGLKSVLDLYDRNGASALIVVYDGKVLLAKGDILRRYDCHSMRKSLISALYGIYSGKKIIDIRRTLKELGIDDTEKLTAQEQSATIQDLLKSRSGVYIPPFGEEQSVKDQRPIRGSHRPNTFFYYNNWDFNVLGSIFQKETGLNVFEAFQESLAKPLQMQDYRPLDGRFWRDSSASTIYPQYDIKMSARDLARFGTLYGNSGVWNGHQILSKDWISESFTPYSTIDHVGYKESYGYLWWIEALDDSILMCSARGWGGHILTVVPKEKLVIVKRHDTYGGSGGDGWTGMYVRQIIKARVAPPKSNPELAPLQERARQMDFIDMPEASLKKYQQRIEMNGRPRKIEFGAYGLVFDDWFLLHPVSETRFYIDDLDKYMYFKLEHGKPIFDRIE